MRRLLPLLALLLSLTAAAVPARAGRQVLTVCIGQYPASLHPSIASLVARYYVLGLARRPFTVYDPDWNLVCMLCTAVPTLENGGAWRQVCRDWRSRPAGGRLASGSRS
ncbi:MAG: hypothetical protein U1E43_10065 [Rhodospirillales bacterium]